MLLTKRSMISGKENKMEINMDETEFNKRMVLFENGYLIQSAFPELNADEREFIKSGVTPEEWENCFKK